MSLSGYRQHTNSSRLLFGFVMFSGTMSNTTVRKKNLNTFLFSFFGHDFYIDIALMQRFTFFCSHKVTIRKKRQSRAPDYEMVFKSLRIYYFHLVVCLSWLVNQEINTNPPSSVGVSKVTSWLLREQMANWRLTSIFLG